jgi:RNA polymerase sigma factor (sigma-70 family)
MRAEAIAAAWEAERDFDPTRGVPIAAFVYGRVLARAWTRYRREWAYARRCGVQPVFNDCEDMRSDRLSAGEASESLQRGLDRLPEHQRRLIQSLFWDEKTQIDVARMYSLRQPTISKRRRRILEQLRHWMRRSEKGNALRE